MKYTYIVAKLTKDVGVAFTSSTTTSPSPSTCDEVALATRDWAPDLCSKSSSIIHFSVQKIFALRRPESQVNMKHTADSSLYWSSRFLLLQPVSYYGEFEPQIQTAD